MASSSNISGMYDVYEGDMDRKASLLSAPRPAFLMKPSEEDPDIKWIRYQEVRPWETY